MSLDTFCSQYTSEDNASFAQLQEQALARKRLRVAHHLADKNQPLLLTGPGASDTDEFGTSGQTPGTLVDVKHVPKNRLYYNTSQQPALELSEKEVLALVQGPPKAIAHAATRLPGDAAGAEQDPAAAVQQLAKEAAAAEGSTAAAAAAAAAGGAAAAHGTSGYGYMRTPNLAPGVDATPLMTWGTIASTPLRLEVDADLQGWQAAMTPSVPLDATPGPQFKMPEQRQREVKALAYINKRTATAAAARRAASGTPLLDALRRRMGSSSRGTPSHGSSSSGAATPLSAAGRALATRLRGSGRTPAGGGSAAGSTGALGPQLRASYNGTPTATAAAAAATRRPVQGGSAGRAAGRAAAAPQAANKQQAVGTPGGEAGQGCITDGLLRLP
jgi:protein DGCR14